MPPRKQVEFRESYSPFYNGSARRAHFQVLVIKLKNKCFLHLPGGANTKLPDMYGVGGFSGPKTQK